MGRDRWNPATYAATAKTLKDDGIDPFAYSKATLRSGGTVHDLLNAADGKIRESNDPGDGKKTTSITVAIDVTGSGGRVPGIIRDDLPTLMGLLSVQGYVEHPNIQVIAFGDATCDSYPLQVSQFEADIKIDECLRAIVLEGGGGGQGRESYELVMWYATYMNKLAAWDRGEKGYLFLIGDEMPYDYVEPEHVRKYVRGHAEIAARRMSLSELMPALLAKYKVYYIICEGSSYYSDPSVLGTWRDLLGGEFVIKLPDPADISELIASIVGYQAGVPLHKIETDLKALGTLSPDRVTSTLAIASSGLSTAHPSTNTRIRRF